MKKFLGWTRYKMVCNGSIKGKIVSEIYRTKSIYRRINSVVDGVEFEANDSQKEYITGLSVLYSCELVIIKKVGIHGLSSRLKISSGLMLGVIIGIVIIGYLSTLVLGVNIKCEMEEYYGKVEQTLKKSGVNVGISIKSLDFDAIEREISKSLIESVFVTVSRYGNMINVEVITQPLTEGFPRGNEQLLSMCRAIVTRVMVNSGRAVVKVGQTVSPSQMLIEGVINTNKDEYQADGEARLVSVPAEGEVYGNTFYHKRIYLKDNNNLTKLSNNVRISRELYIAGKRIGKESKSPYELYESVTSYEVIKVLMPITVKTVTYYQLEVYQLDRLSYQELSLQEARAQIIDSLPEGSRLIGEQVIVSQVSNDILDLYIEVERRIDSGGHNYAYSRLQSA